MRFSVAVLTSSLLFIGCGQGKIQLPHSFVQLNDMSRGKWKVIELRGGLEYEEAWNILVDIIAMKWDIDVINYRAGYLRSDWFCTTGRDEGTGRLFTYRRRISVNFTGDRTKVQIRTEANYEVQEFPTAYGFDSAFDQDVLNEISGRLGRTSR